MLPNNSGFILFVSRHRSLRKWTRAELARRAGLSQPEVSRLESGRRMPTMRHVRGLAVAFAGAQTGQTGEPSRYEDWLAILVDFAERSRKDTLTMRSNSALSRAHLKAQSPRPTKLPVTDAVETDEGAVEHESNGVHEGDTEE